MGRIGPLLENITYASSTTIAVATTGVVYTDHFNLSLGEYFGLECIFTSLGNVNVKIELEQGNAAPTANAATAATWRVPDAVSAIATVTDESLHIYQMAPVVTKFGRFKLTGLAGNDASTTVAMKRTYIENF